MLDKIKKIQGINNTDFDSIIDGFVASAKSDLEAIGISSSKITSGTDDLINTAIITYVLSMMNVENTELYMNSYNLQKDVLRHYSSYLEE